MKKFIALVLAVFMVVGLFGCSTGSQPGNSSNPANQGNPTGSKPSDSQNPGNQNPGGDYVDMGGKSWEQVLAEMPQELRGTSITVYNWNALSEYPGASAVIEEFTRQTGIEVNWVTENFSTYLAKLSSKVAGNDAPDVVRLRAPLASGMLSMQPVSVAGFDFTDGAWDKWVAESYTYHGEVYGVSLANTQISSPGMLLYNKALIEKYDLNDPYTMWKRGNWTYEKMIELMKDFKEEADADFAMSIYDYSELSSIFGITGPVGFDGEKYYNQMTEGNFVNVTQDIADMMNSDRLLAKWKVEEFESGKCLFWSGTAVYARRQNSYFTGLKESGSLMAVPYPTAEGQDEEYVLYSELEAYGIPKGAKNPEAVPYFLRFFLDRNNYDMDAYFCSSQALEVYDYCMGLENKLWTTLYNEQTQYHGDLAIDEFSNQLKEATGSQIINVIDSTTPSIEQRIKRYNEHLEQMRK